MTLLTTRYFDDFLNYYRKAKLLQNNCNLGGQPYIGSCGDVLMENVHIYDTVERCHAGFQNMLQDLWWGSSAPKFYKWTFDHQKRNESYDGLHSKWTRYEWTMIFLIHRLTGSGASFESDHGYRNTILPDLARFSSMEEMLHWIHNHDGKMYTSIGNQIPMFPKAKHSDLKPGKIFFKYYAKTLCLDIWEYINRCYLEGEVVTIRKLKDFMVDWNHEHNLKRFHFQYTAVAADFADYFPAFVEESSPMYYGKNCLEAMDLFISKDNNIKKEKARDLSMELASKKTGGKPKDLEDVMCDYIRYVENYIPINREQTYAHLDPDKIWNNSMIIHNKGRQRYGS